MALPGMMPLPTSKRVPPWVSAVLATVVVSPVVLYSMLLSRTGWRSDALGLFLSRVLFAKDRGQLELLGFEYPPLPFLMLLPWPTEVWALTLGALAAIALTWMVLDLCYERRSVLPFLLLVALLWSPFGAQIIAGDFNEVVGLTALYAGWRQYRKWWESRRTVYGLYTGLWLGLAFYTSPLGLALALIAGAVLPALFPRLQIPPFASQLSLLVFPGFAASATWAYLAWVLTHRVALPFTPWAPNSPGLTTVLLWSAPYLLISAVALSRPKATTAGMLLPLVLFALANVVGWHYSLAYAVTFLTLVAMVAIPIDLGRAPRALIVTAAALQCFAAWIWLPTPTPTAADLTARAVATALADAPPRSILIDDRRAAMLMKWAPSLAPYLTTRDMGFDIALTGPHAEVEYVLVTTDEAGASLDAVLHPPVGFIADWSWEGYTLYRRPDVAKRMVRYSQSVASRGGSQP